MGGPGDSSGSYYPPFGEGNDTPTIPTDARGAVPPTRPLGGAARGASASSDGDHDDGIHFVLGVRSPSGGVPASVIAAAQFGESAPLRARRRRSVAALAAVLLLVLLAGCATWALLSGSLAGLGLPTISAPGGISIVGASATASGTSESAATPTAKAGATPKTGPGSTGGGSGNGNGNGAGGSGSGTGADHTGDASATATPTPLPQIVVSPTTSSGKCLLGQWPTLSVRNTGGGELDWTATTDQNLVVKAKPASGQVGPGASEGVTFSGVLHLGGKLTVEFASNGGSAVAVVNCS